MLRAVGGAVIGYFAMFIAVFVVLSVVYLSIGPERAFRPESWSPSTGWLVMSILVGFGAALLGGAVCTYVGRDKRGTLMLIGMVVVLGFVSVFTSPVENIDRPEIRSPEVGNMEALQYATQPHWMAYMNISLGALGILVGSTLPKKKKSRAPAPPAP